MAILMPDLTVDVSQRRLPRAVPDSVAGGGR